MPGFDYLKPWDILDCKFVGLLGMVRMTVPNLILTIFAGLITGGLGIVFVLFSLIFAFFYIYDHQSLAYLLVSIIAITY